MDTVADNGVYPEPFARETEFVLRFAAGTPGLLGELHRRFGAELRSMAERLFRRFHVGRTVYDEDDAVNDAEYTLGEIAAAGDMRWVASRVDLLKECRCILRRRILDWGRHEATLKECGGHHQREAAVGSLHASEPSALDVAAAKLGHDRLVAALNDPAAKVILDHLVDGRSCRETARAMGRSRSFIWRRIKLIRHIAESTDLGLA
jgi:hypothetical protein